MTRPSAPTYARVTLGNASVALTWESPADHGSSPVDRYIVERSTDGANFSSGTTTTSLHAILRRLVPGTEYWFRVRAHNADGYGAPAGVGPRVAIAVPGRVTVVATAGDGQVNLSFLPSTDGGASIDGYLVEQYLPGIDDWVEMDSPTSPAATISGLENGQAHSFRVSAHNAAGYGQTRKAVATPTGRPTAPLNLVLDVVGIDEAYWDPPASDGGMAVDVYRVEYWEQPLPGFMQGPYEVTTAARTVAVHGAAKVRVQAHNAHGWGDWSATVFSPHYSP